MYTLYYSPGAASMAVHLALLEIGAPYRLERVDLAAKERSPAYLELNPRGQVPTLIVEGRPYFESAGLLQLLAERHPEAGLAPEPGRATRPAYLQWMAFLATALGGPFRYWFRPQDLGLEQLTGDLREAFSSRIDAGWAIVDAELGANGPYLLGKEFSVADVLALTYLRWSRNLPRPATDRPALKRYADALRERQSWQQLCEREGLTEWVR